MVGLSVLPKIRIIYESGEPERTIEFEGPGPFSHDGEPGSILDVLLGHGIHLEHACGGKCACTTCHVIVKEGEAHLSPSTEKEDDELDTAPGLTMHSRLGCQAVVSGDITIVIPKYTINQISGSH
jgi:2Fe-2S ferredoxin